MSWDDMHRWWYVRVEAIDVLEVGPWLEVNAVGDHLWPCPSDDGMPMVGFAREEDAVWFRLALRR
jgi:hypothetical protein